MLNYTIQIIIMLYQPFSRHAQKKNKFQTQESEQKDNHYVSFRSQKIHSL